MGMSVLTAPITLAWCDTFLHKLIAAILRGIVTAAPPKSLLFTTSLKRTKSCSPRPAVTGVNEWGKVSEANALLWRTGDKECAMGVPKRKKDWAGRDPIR